MSTLSKATLSLYAKGHRIYSRTRGRLEERAEQGQGLVELILIILGVIVAAGIVIAAITVYLRSKTAELGN